MRVRGRTRAGRALAVLVLSLAAAVALPEPARAGSAPDAGTRWEPPPLTAPEYGIKPPSADPGQIREVVAADGVRLYTQTWLPAARDGHAPPARLPVVVQFTP